MILPEGLFDLPIEIPSFIAEDRFILLMERSLKDNDTMNKNISYINHSIFVDKIFCLRDMKYVYDVDGSLFHLTVSANENKKCLENVVKDDFDIFKRTTYCIPVFKYNEINVPMFITGFIANNMKEQI